MIDDILKLLEKIIQLGEVRTRRKATLFSQHVEPLFEMSRKVYEDYAKGIAEVATYLEPTPPRVDEALGFLQKRREEHRHFPYDVKTAILHATASIIPQYTVRFQLL